MFNSMDSSGNKRQRQIMCHKPARLQFKEFTDKEHLYNAAYFYLVLSPSGTPHEGGLKSPQGPLQLTLGDGMVFV